MLYFFPQEQLDAKGQLIDAESLFKANGVWRSLHDIADGRYTAFETTMFGKPGVFLSPHLGGVPNPVRAYSKDKQIWIDIDPENTRPLYTGYGLHVGYDIDHPPGPESLVRDRVYIGYEVGEDKWKIPIARAGKNTVTLPHIYEFDYLTEAPKSIPDPEFSELWKAAGELFDHWCGDSPLTDDQLALHAMRVLSVNYRLGPIEHHVLTQAGRPVLDSDMARSICMCLIDNQISDPVQKKEDTESESETPAET